MLWGGRLLIAYWPFAFNEYLAIKNASLPHCGAVMSGVEKAGSEPISRASIHLAVASGSNILALSQRNTVLMPRKDDIMVTLLMAPRRICSGLMMLLAESNLVTIHASTKE
jgi:hypothetical protein